MGPPAPNRWVVGIVLAVVAPGLRDGSPARAAAPPTARAAGLEARVRQLEAQVETLARRLETADTAPPPPGVPAAPTPRFEMAAPAAKPPLKGRFGPGFEWKTDDDEFFLQFRDLTQVDGRFFRNGGQDPVHDTFGIPAQWFIFSGRLTKPYEFYTSLAQGFNALNILDVFLNIHHDDRLQVRIGRYFVPFTYELYILPLDALITPERSVFFNNFANNRDLGVMAWGQLFEKRVDYAAGIFNGIRNGFVDTNDAKDFVGFLNVRPFGTSGIPGLEYLNVGGSVDYGVESNVPSPQTLRTIVPAPGNAAIGVPFLGFNADVREFGTRSLWSLHLAYYYRHLSVVAEWEGGSEDFARVDNPSRIFLPIESYYVQSGYFLTGETVSGRGPVKPLRPFDLRRGHRGPGAVELSARYNLFGLGHQVFTGGLADPNLWTDRLDTIDIGLNWCLTQYLKVAFVWEHADFARPVLIRPGALQSASDLFLIRFQIRF